MLFRSQDKKDNDLDGLIDYPADPGCLSKYDDDETNEEGCKEYWSCSIWYECVEGIQARTCIDINACETTNLKPKETQECISEKTDVSSPPEKDMNETLKLIDSGKITGKVIEVKPQTSPNPYYMLPSILLLVILVALIALKKTKLSKRMKKIITILHVSLIIIILLLFGVSFLDTSINGLAVMNDTFTLKDTIKTFSLNKVGVTMLITTAIAIIIAIASLILRKRKKRKNENKR